MFRRFFVVAIFIQFSAYSPASHAEDNDPNSEQNCSAIRLDKDGGPFSQIPVYDQMRFAKEDSNVCYAISIAQLVDARRGAHGEKIPPLSAPLSIALNYKNQKYGSRSEEHTSELQSH